MNEIEKIVNDQSFIMLCESLYSIFRCKKEELSELSNRTYNVTFKEAIDFSISSNAISIIKSFFYGTLHSYSNLLIIRNIIEDLALNEMYIKGKITKESQELIKYNGFIEDYKQYEMYKDDSFNILIDYDKLVNDYKKSLNEYEKYGITENKIKKMRIPFLMKKLSYEDIIKENLPDFSQAYNLLSYFIHPHKYNSNEEIENIYKIFVFIINKLANLYISLDVNIKQESFFTSEKNLLLFNCINIPTNYRYKFLMICNEQKEILINLRKKICEKLGENNYIILLLDLIADIVVDLCTDSIHGQSESCKMKFKTIIEIFALYHWLFFMQNKINLENDNIYFKLTELYSHIKFNEVFGNSSEICYKKAYDIFSKYMSKEGKKIDYSKFKNEKHFSKTLGFTIDSDGVILSINAIVNNYIDNNYNYIIPNKIIDYRENKNIAVDISASTLLKVMYAESNSIGHGKAYLFYSNTGAFCDDINTITFVDSMLLSFLRKYSIAFKIIDVYNEYESVLKEIDKHIKKLEEISLKKRYIIIES